MPRSAFSLLTTFAVALWMFGATLHAETFILDEDASVLAVVTHKAGIGASLAHNHFIAASGYDATLTFDAGDLSSASFTLSFPSSSLKVDDPDLQSTWYARLEALEILDEPFGELSESNRGKIREAMLGKKQLNAEKFPKIIARLVKLAEGTSTVGSEDFPHQATIAFTVHGTEIERDVAAKVWQDDDGSLRIEAVGEFTFSEFGVKPYSAMLGAVKNEDGFHVFVSLKATPAETSAP